MPPLFLENKTQQSFLADISPDRYLQTSNLHFSFSMINKYWKTQQSQSPSKNMKIREYNIYFRQKKYVYKRDFINTSLIQIRDARIKKKKFEHHYFSSNF